MNDVSKLAVVVHHVLAGQLHASDDITTIEAVAEKIESAFMNDGGFWLHEEEPGRRLYIPSWMVKEIALVGIAAPQSQSQVIPAGNIPPHLLQS